jgi:hypothetical protein
MRRPRRITRALTGALDQGDEGDFMFKGSELQSTAIPQATQSSDSRHDREQLE